MSLTTFWARLRRFLGAIYAATLEFLKPKPTPIPGYVIRKNGVVEDGYISENETYPAINITNNLELLLCEFKEIPKVFDQFDLNKKTGKFNRPVYIEPDESTVAAHIFLENIKKDKLLQEARTELNTTKIEHVARAHGATKTAVLKG
jgi:hypothetical protein